MRTLAAIDVGSNAIRMIVARIIAPGQLEILENTRLPVRLGQDVFSVGQIGAPVMQLAVDAFMRFRIIADQFQVDQVRAVATSAMREAENSDLLIDRIARQSNIQLEIISGEEEARLIHLGVSRAVDLRSKQAVLIDIGGGSVEVTISLAEQIVSSESYAMGTVRLLQRLDIRDTSSTFNKLLSEYTEAARRRIDHELGDEKVDLCIGTGGNIEEMGLLRKKLFKRESDRVITLRELKSLIEKLSDMSVVERMKKFNLRPDRADVILPAAMVLHMIAREARVKEILIPCVGLKDGVLWEMASLESGPRLPRREQVWASATSLGRKYQFDELHGMQTARIAGRIFDQTLSVHNLDESDRLLLKVGALLHDIGHYINTIDHDQHGGYILQNSPLIGLDPRQQEIVANTIRFHRKTTPGIQDEHFKSLAQKDRLVVIKLCALLRLADGIAVSHTDRIRDVTLEKVSSTWECKMHGDGDFLLEKWTLGKRKSLFQEVFGVDLQIIE